MPPTKRTTSKIHNNQISLSYKHCLKIFRKVPKSTAVMKGASSHTCLAASFTLEAAVVMPLFAGFMVAILFFFRIMQVERGIEEALHYTGRKLAAESFAENYIEDFGEPIAISYAWLTLCNYLEKEEVPTEYISFGKLGIRLLESEITESRITLQADYSMKLPIDFFGMKLFSISQSICVRKWTGYHEEIETDEITGEELVYVTKNGTVYHRSRECSYLNPSIQSVGVSEVQALRNESGHKYYACESCAGGQTGSLYYITDYGDCYHTSLNCSGLKRGITMLRISEVGGRGACSKCGY